VIGPGIVPPSLDAGIPVRGSTLGTSLTARSGRARPLSPVPFFWKYVILKDFKSFVL